GEGAAGSQTFHQHAPASASHVGTTNNELLRHDRVFAAGGAVHEHGIQREVTATGITARSIASDQGEGTGNVLFATQHTVRVIEAEGQTQQGAHRSQRDVALVPGDAHAQHFLTFPFAFANNTYVRNGGGIGTGPRAGQCESGNVTAICQTGQVVLFLF